VSVLINNAGVGGTRRFDLADVNYIIPLSIERYGNNRNDQAIVFQFEMQEKAMC
jgi:hypothetical protein